VHAHNSDGATFWKFAHPPFGGNIGHGHLSGVSSLSLFVASAERGWPFDVVLRLNI